MAGITGPENPPKSEAELARQWNTENAKDARLTKFKRLAWAAILALVAAVLALWSLYVWAFIAMGCAVVAFVMYVDANGHEHEIKERSNETLVPRLSSVLGPGSHRRELESGESKPSASEG